MSQKQPAAPPPADPANQPVPSPEAQAEAAPTKAAVKQAVSAIKTPQQAAEVAEQVIGAAQGTSEQAVRNNSSSADAQERAVAAATNGGGAGAAPATILAAAEQVASSSGEQREAIEQALQSALNPETTGQADPATEHERNLLREAILAQMRPYQQLDARLFLAINQLPHTSVLNWLMGLITAVMTGGFGWVGGLAIAALLNRRRHRRVLRQVAPPLWFATLVVEYPIKFYFRRQRPFIDIVQAITIGKKPGSYSFPSGHSASAFAGAWLLCRFYPQLAPLWYAIAALVGFSRIYLGVHYPGDVLSGALLGTLLAEGSHWLLNEGED